VIDSRGVAGKCEKFDFFVFELRVLVRPSCNFELLFMRTVFVETIEIHVAILIVNK